MHKQDGPAAEQGGQQQAQDHFLPVEHECYSKIGAGGAVAAAYLRLSRQRLQCFALLLDAPLVLP
jgi:hypothetical protein